MIRKMILVPAIFTVMAHSASFISVSTEEKQQYLTLLEMTAKERIFVLKWAKTTKDSFRQHKHFGYTLESIAQLFLLEEPSRKLD